jgi:hypothetical protein
MAYFGLKVLDMIHHQTPASLLTNFAEDTRSPIPTFVDTGGHAGGQEQRRRLREGQRGG